jgi:hypothetical protein
VPPCGGTGDQPVSTVKTSRLLFGARPPPFPVCRKTGKPSCRTPFPTAARAARPKPASQP